MRRHFVAANFPPEFADAYIAMLAATADTPALVTHEVDKILGRPAQSFADAISAHQEQFTKHQGK